MTTRLDAEFDELWRLTSPKLRAYMFCACRTWHDADDLVQECYYKAVRSWRRFDGKASRQAWLFAIARNTRADFFRKKKSRPNLVALDKAEEPIEQKPKSTTERIDLVWRSLNNLDREQREVIHLRFTARLSYAEMAQALGIPVGTVRSRLHRGLKSVRKLIEEKENES